MKNWHVCMHQISKVNQITHAISTCMLLTIHKQIEIINNKMNKKMKQIIAQMSYFS